jgi:hypothetical protein
MDKVHCAACGKECRSPFTEDAPRTSVARVLAISAGRSRGAYRRVNIASTWAIRSSDCTMVWRVANIAESISAVAAAYRALLASRSVWISRWRSGENCIGICAPPAAGGSAIGLSATDACRTSLGR